MAPECVQHLVGRDAVRFRLEVQQDAVAQGRFERALHILTRHIVATVQQPKHLARQNQRLRPARFYTNCAAFTIAPSVGSPRFARGTTQGFGSPCLQGNLQEGVVNCRFL